MFINNAQDEVKKREKAFEIIIKKINNNEELYDLTGLSGGFLLNDKDISLLETYVGSAIFENKLQSLGKEHLSGEKILPVNRTSSGILATILALVPKNTHIIHYLPQLPAHPSIPRSAKLVGAKYLEFDNINEFHIPENTSLIIVTGSTMDHQIIDLNEFTKIIGMAHSQNIPVFVDDASGARLRTIIFKQPKAYDLGADIVVTSTDKLMPGPRGGLMTGKKELIDQIKLKTQEFGLEAQAPLTAAMVKALEYFNPDNILNSIQNKEELANLLSIDFYHFKQSPTGIMISENGILNELKMRNIETQLSPQELSFLWAMILLGEENILTIPAVGMPGASATLRFDLADNSAQKLKIDTLFNKIQNSFHKLEKLATQTELAKKTLLQ